MLSHFDSFTKSETGTAGTAESITPAEPNLHSAVVDEPVPIHAEVETPPIEPPVTRPSSLESQVGLTLINRIGVITLVLGVAFFFKWAVDNNWIGPAGRVILGILAGLATVAAGDFSWRKRQVVFAQGITASGLAIIYLALYAAFDFYQLIPQWAAFVLMVATTTFGAALALRYNSFAIAALGLAAAYVTPLLLSRSEDHPWFLFSYLLLLNFAATELAVRRRWLRLEIISLVATTLLYGGWLLQRDTNAETRLVATVAPLAFCAQRWRTQTPLLFSFSQFLSACALALIWRNGEWPFLPLALLVAAGGLLFAHVRSAPAATFTAFAGFWLSYFMHMVYHQEPVPQFWGASCGFVLFLAWSWWHLVLRRTPPTTLALSVFSLNGVVYFADSYSLLRPQNQIWTGPLAALVAAVYLVFGIRLHRQAQTADSDTRPVVLALGVALSFLTLAIPIQFSGFTVTIAWAIQAAALAWIGYRFSNKRAVSSSAVVFGLVILRLLLEEFESLPDPSSYVTIANSRFLTFAVSGTAMLLTAWWGSKIFRVIALASYFSGNAVLLIGFALEIHGWAARSTNAENRLSVETLAITLLFGVYAVILIIAGVATRSAINRVSGLCLIGIMILKLYLFDVWQLSRPYQIAAFVILGILLLATSFLYSRFRRLIESWWKDDETSA